MNMAWMKVSRLVLNGKLSMTGHSAIAPFTTISNGLIDPLINGSNKPVTSGKNDFR